MKEVIERYQNNTTRIGKLFSRVKREHNRTPNVEEFLTDFLDYCNSTDEQVDGLLDAIVQQPEPPKDNRWLRVPIKYQEFDDDDEPGEVLTESSGELVFDVHSLSRYTQHRDNPDWTIVSLHSGDQYLADLPPAAFRRCLEEEFGEAAINVKLYR